MEGEVSTLSVFSWDMICRLALPVFLTLCFWKQSNRSAVINFITNKHFLLKLVLSVRNFIVLMG